jgi:general secretion pathway protein A
VLYALDVDTAGETAYVRLFQRLQEFLITEYAEGRRCILIIDEAQNLSLEGLEELRMLTNVNANKDELLQLVLVGQPELAT